MTLDPIAINAVVIPVSAREPSGMIRIWNVRSKKWESVASIDARERVVLGVGNFDGPQPEAKPDPVPKPTPEPKPEPSPVTEPRPQTIASASVPKQAERRPRGGYRGPGS